MPTVQNSVIDEDEIDTILGRDIQFSGTVKTDKSLLLKGEISGTILCGDDLYLSPEAIVDAVVHAGRITVRGGLKGNAIAAESIQVLAGSSVEASLEAPDIIIEDEERFKGTVALTGNDEID
ncbi:MAG TPA: polymer-forming cytoskeletal protein [Rectinemataceae bacterium]|nr:polymer-forming cytoskeletal protein [Rectinemataceae bacterium]